MALIYRKSILYLVSRALQKWRGIEPIMGMEIYKDELNGVGSDDRIQTYNPELHRDATRAEDHSGFPQDATTMNKMLELILGKYPEYPFQQNKLGDN